MVHVAARVAEIKQISLQEVLQQNLVSASQIYKKFFERRNVLGEEEKEEEEEEVKVKVKV